MLVAVSDVSTSAALRQRGSDGVQRSPRVVGCSLLRGQTTNGSLLTSACCELRADCGTARVLLFTVNWQHICSESLLICNHALKFIITSKVLLFSNYCLVINSSFLISCQKCSFWWWWQSWGCLKTKSPNSFSLCCCHIGVVHSRIVCQKICHQY